MLFWKGRGSKVISLLMELIKAVQRVLTTINRPIIGFVHRARPFHLKRYLPRVRMPSRRRSIVHQSRCVKAALYAVLV